VNRRLAAEVRQRTEAEGELKAANKELTFAKFAIDNAPDAIEWLRSESAEMVYVNDKSCEMLGYSQSDLLKRTVFDFDPVFNKEAWPDFRTGLRREGRMTFESVWEPKDKARFPVEISARSLAYEGADYFLAFIRDISEKKEAQAELQAAKAETERANEKLRETNRELESFAYSVSHDLRAPLRAISGFSEIIAKRYSELLPDRGRHYFDNIVEATGQMERLIDDLLRYSRLGKSAVECKAVPLPKLFASLKDKLSTIAEEAGGIVRLPEDGPNVLGNFTLLEQIFVNLIDNAFKYRRPGVSPQVAVTCDSAGSGDVAVSVTDNGVGIPEGMEDKVFQIFQRLHSQEEVPGTGIGLALVKKAVALLSGRITLQSESNADSTFIIYLRKAQDGA
jgi:PAS domain S-box-containing protein